MAQVHAFWRNFLRMLPQLTAGEEPSQAAMEELLSCLEEVDSRLYFFIGSTDDGMDLVLSAEGYPDLMPVVMRIKAAAPVVPGWRVLSAYDAELLFGQRNEHIFPKTESGDVLYKMAQNGDALWIERPVNFSLVFSTAAAARQFAARIAVDKLACDTSPYDGAEGYTYQVEVTIPLIPTYANIERAEARFSSLAKPFGGRNDGWGCFEVAV